LVYSIIVKSGGQANVYSGERFHAVLVDNGVMRLNECLQETLQKHIGINLRIIDGSKLFLDRLKGVTEPETKRAIIGGNFIDLSKRRLSGLRK
jgi:GMP synthase (glutamine-hydrolysing)